MNRSILWGCMLALASAMAAPVAHAETVVPVVKPSNPSCPDGKWGYKIEYPASKTYWAPEAGGSVTLVKNGAYYDWASTFGVSEVIAKGGADANVYTYDPPKKSWGDTGLHAPENPYTYKPYDMSHMTVCYDLNLEVTKTAETSFDRKWEWTIKKYGDPSYLKLKEYQKADVNYEVDVKADYKDSNWKVKGEITIYNPTGIDAKITGVTDVVNSVTYAEVDCGYYEFPIVLKSKDTLVCTYKAALPDGYDGENVVKVETYGKVGGAVAKADVEFKDPSYQIDRCVDVSDDKYGDLGKVCAHEAPKAFKYTQSIGPFYCGEHKHTNKASFVTHDTYTYGSAEHTVYIEVDCDKGCTLTQGYWKTHSEKGPAPYDQTWAYLPYGAGTTFFKSELSWYDVFWTPKAGNAYYILAPQYMAAVLNGMAGADLTAVSATLAKAKAFFEAYTPTDWSESKSVVVGWANDLDAFNNGHTGPGHCDE